MIELGVFGKNNLSKFESIVHAQWKSLEFITTDFKKELDLGAYTYKMIQGIDFYNFVLSIAKKFKNVTFVQETIISMDADAEIAVLKTTENSYSARYIFNSTALFSPEITEENSLLQHFKGWVIQAKEPVFNPKVGRLMDFSLSQEHGATFMYVLPTSPTEALVEYTLFSPNLLEKEAYTVALKKYIQETLKIEQYTLLHEEFGVIPMSLARFDKNPKRAIVNLGTAGGYTKASSGYTFQFIQKNVADIVENLKSGKNPNQRNSLKDNIYQWYDRTLIDVLLTKKLTGKEVFATIFQKVPAEKILAFLGNESSLVDDFTIMKSLPLLPFLTSGIQQLGARKS
ncbi:lycopene cyclase family protein [Polaribacter sp. HL-MS24]|uniref:lycopene cyclase family protein n=1 Tax=Polaribacter sp. HL-MS24 TaxID=3077735 RepID=UPI002934863D|nr:lycopene cyclase family protein [Polaribacter sp. HL-MS24]WOC40925.1 lycopene cyclase family protein [Polaribacter sp. HL-MS24]